jgi:hypothetical protein
MERQSPEARLNQLRRNDLSQDELLLQAQLTAQIQIFVHNNETHFALIRHYEQQYQQIINVNIHMRQYLQNDDIKHRLSQIELNCSTLF